MKKKTPLGKHDVELISYKKKEKHHFDVDGRVIYR